MEKTFEQAFADAERSAAVAAKAGTAVVSAAKSMQKAAKEGDISKLRKAAEKLVEATSAVRQDVANAKTSWPFSEQEEREYLKESYSIELSEEASERGLQIHSRDDRLLAYPSMLRILPNELAVNVDRKRVPSIRPSYLVDTLLANQKKKSRYHPERFLESLLAAYSIIIQGADKDGAVIRLSKVYQALTLQPGASTEYSKSDFARDIFMVDQSGIRSAKSGARLSLHASTGTKGSISDLFTFVAPNGEVLTYYGIRFTRDGAA